MLKIARPMAYASEVGESFRPIVSRNVVRFLYGISWAYVIVDTGVSTYEVKRFGQEAMQYTCLDKAIWHTFASMLLPAFTIHTIVHQSGNLFKKIFGKTSKLGVWLPVALGLCSIPFIIHPLDHLTDYVMDNTLREYVYKGKIPSVASENQH